MYDYGPHMPDTPSLEQLTHELPKNICANKMEQTDQAVQQRIAIIQTSQDHHNDRILLDNSYDSRPLAARILCKPTMQ